MKSLVKNLLPADMVASLRSSWRGFRRARIRTWHRAANLFGLSIAKGRDYNSVLPVLEELCRTRERWDRPSDLVGVRYDLTAMKRLFAELIEQYAAPVLPAAAYTQNADRGFGPGYPRVDAITSYAMLRKLKPARYLEVGGGLSTFYAFLAGQENAREGRPMQITCVEPYPSDLLRSMQGVNLIVDQVQNVPASRFAMLERGDVLFIDSTHALRIDSDVAYLFLEIVPRVAVGAWVHVHDIPFPYNTPFPSDLWVLGDRWPVYWQEAMLLQAFLTFNKDFEIRLSTPLIRHADESFVGQRIPDYAPLAKVPHTYSSIWIERVG